MKSHRDMHAVWCGFGCWFPCGFACVLMWCWMVFCMRVDVCLGFVFLSGFPLGLACLLMRCWIGDWWWLHGFPRDLHAFWYWFGLSCMDSHRDFHTFRWCFGWVLNWFALGCVLLDGFGMDSNGDVHELRCGVGQVFVWSPSLHFCLRSLRLRRKSSSWASVFY